MRSFLYVGLSVGLVFVASVAWAGTASDIRRPPVTSMGGFPSTGPAGVDALAAEGQWFLEKGTTDQHNVRSHEFYDNRKGSGGSDVKSTLAIEGYVQNIGWKGTAGASAILSFEILATITNDLSVVDLSGASRGSNAHGEEILPQNLAWYTDTAKMFDAVLTAEFSIDESKPSPGTDVYGKLSPAIVAVNHDQLAWYCWTQDNSAEGQLKGDFQVPAWDFGDILPGQSATEVLQFTISDTDNGLQNNDSRWQVIADSEKDNDDILLNRSTSLKISEWVDDLAVDPGYSYPYGVGRSSDSSVFFNTIPEPATAVNLGLGALMLLGLVLRRRAKK